MPLALFDLDHTLLDGDSNALWLDYLVARDLAPAAVLSAQAAHYAAYREERLDIGVYLDFQLSVLAGRSLEAWQPVRAAFVQQVLAPRIADAGLAAVARHRRQGHRLAIVTATHGFLAEAVGAHLHLPVVAPRVRVDADGWRIEGPLCFRDGKLDCLARWLECPRLGEEELAASHFYSDSANDLALLEAVGHPVAVNADPRLAAVARARGWPRLEWRQPGAIRVS